MAEGPRAGQVHTTERGGGGGGQDARPTGSRLKGGGEGKKGGKKTEGQQPKRSPGHVLRHGGRKAGWRQASRFRSLRPDCSRSRRIFHIFGSTPTILYVADNIHGNSVSVPCSTEDFRKRADADPSLRILGFFG